MSLVWRRSRASGNNMLVLLSIADFAQDDGRHFWQSNHGLQEKARLSERGLRYILRNLERTREIVIERNTARIRPERCKYETPERFIHVRCVYDWVAYQREGGQTLPVQTAKSGRGDDQNLPVYKRKDLLVDLLVDPKAVKAAPLPRRPARLEDAKASYGLLQKLVHDALDSEAFESFADLTEAVKVSAGQLQVTYAPEELAKAVASVLLVRGVEQRARRAIV